MELILTGVSSIGNSQNSNAIFLNRSNIIFHLKAGTGFESYNL